WRLLRSGSRQRDPVRDGDDLHRGRLLLSGTRREPTHTYRYKRGAGGQGPRRRALIDRSAQLVGSSEAWIIGVSSPDQFSQYPPSLFFSLNALPSSASGLKMRSP